MDKTIRGRNELIELVRKNVVVECMQDVIAHAPLYLCNHECVNFNATVTEDLQLRTSENIKKGDQIFINYRNRTFFKQMDARVVVQLARVKRGDN